MLSGDDDDDDENAFVIRTHVVIRSSAEALDGAIYERRRRRKRRRRRRRRRKTKTKKQRLHFLGLGI